MSGLVTAVSCNCEGSDGKRGNGEVINEEGHWVAVCMSWFREVIYWIELSSSIRLPFLRLYSFHLGPYQTIPNYIPDKAYVSIYKCVKKYYQQGYLGSSRQLTNADGSFISSRAKSTSCQVCIDTNGRNGNLWSLEDWMKATLSKPL